MADHRTKRRIEPRLVPRDGPDPHERGGGRRRRFWRRPSRRVVLACAKWGLIAAIWLAVLAGGTLAWFARDLPDIQAINTFNRRPSLTFVGVDGQVVATYGDLFGGAVTLKELPPHLIEAVLATEDRRFHDHGGLDPLGIARALIANLRAGRVVQGGSTITQQLAKIAFLTPDRTIKRKVQETMLALWLERRFTKDQILAIYLNRVYLGAGTYGVEAASRRYFAKPARALGRHESAVIAGLLKAPSRYAPTTNLPRARERAGEVLDNMVEAGFLSASAAAAVAREPLLLPPASVGARGSRYFTDWLLEEVPGYVGMGERDLVVVTTLDPRLQRLAEIETELMLEREAGRAQVSQAALVAMAPDGAVRAMVGGRDYADSQFNRATDAQRQPGSAFKPFVFLAAVEAGLRPDDMLADGPITLRNWSPRNFDDTLKGQITAREALARSVNTATVRAAQRAGIERVVAAAHRLGITSELRRDFATTLGASEVNLLELTGAMAPFANGGSGAIAYGIAEIRDSAGRVLYRRAGGGPGRVVQRPALAAMTDMLMAVIRAGTGRAAALDRPAAGKTGTSQDFRDAWFVGFTADLVAGVWLGNDDGQPMQQVTGGVLPARLWRAFMAEAHRGLPVRTLPGQLAVEDVVQAPTARVPPPAAATPSAVPAQRGTIMNSREPATRSADD